MTHRRCGQQSKWVCNTKKYRQNLQRKHLITHTHFSTVSPRPFALQPHCLRQSRISARSPRANRNGPAGMLWLCVFCFAECVDVRANNVRFIFIRRFSAATVFAVCCHQSSPFISHRIWQHKIRHVTKDVCNEYSNNVKVKETKLLLRRRGRRGDAGGENEDGATEIIARDDFSAVLFRFYLSFLSFGTLCPLARIRHVFVCAHSHPPSIGLCIQLSSFKSPTLHRIQNENRIETETD